MNGFWVTRRARRGFVFWFESSRDGAELINRAVDDWARETGWMNIAHKLLCCEKNSSQSIDSPVMGALASLPSVPSAMQNALSEPLEDGPDPRAYTVLHTSQTSVESRQV